MRRNNWLTENLAAYVVAVLCLLSVCKLVDAEELDLSLGDSGGAYLQQITEVSDSKAPLGFAYEGILSKDFSIRIYPTYENIFRLSSDVSLSNSTLSAVIGDGMVSLSLQDILAESKELRTICGDLVARGTADIDGIGNVNVDVFLAGFEHEHYYDCYEGIFFRTCKNSACKYRVRKEKIVHHKKTIFGITLKWSTLEPYYEYMSGNCHNWYLGCPCF